MLCSPKPAHTMSKILSPLKPMRFGSCQIPVPAQPSTLRATGRCKRPRSNAGLSELSFKHAVSDGSDPENDIGFAGEARGSGDGADSAKEDDARAFDGHRRRVKRKASRIARPRDSMPGFRRRPRGSRGMSSGGGFKGGGTGTPGIGKKYLNRRMSVASYYGKETVNGGEEDEGHVQGNAASDEIQGLERRLARSDGLQEEHVPNCLDHGLQCERHVVKKRGANKGRVFFKCGHSQRYQQCSFFMWEDEMVISDDSLDDANGKTSCLAQSVVSVRAATLKPCEGRSEMTDSAMPEDGEGSGWSEESQVEELRAVLREVFDHDEFRAGQVETLLHLLRGESSLAILPTGGGKSLIFQLFAAIQPGIVVVITPLISLMVNQLASLPERIPGACLRSGQSFAATLATEGAIRAGTIKVLYVTPERLFSERFRNLVSSSPDGAFSLVVLDEAHCISEMGHNFRTSYLRLEKSLFAPVSSQDAGLLELNSLSAASEQARCVFANPTILGLTATATEAVITDICHSLRISKANVVRDRQARENLSLTVSRVDGSFDSRARELTRRLSCKPFSTYVLKTGSGQIVAQKTLCHSWGGRETSVTRKVGKRCKASAATPAPSGIVIIYVSKQRECDNLCNYLRSSRLRFFGKVEAYHAGMTSAARTNVQRDFDKGRISVLVATIAFGMGLDCSSVRGVIHFDIPFSVEAYSQEIGRAGRDGRSASCHLLFNEHDALRLRSRAHSDGIDSSTVRGFLKRLLCPRDIVAAKESTCRVSVRGNNGGTALHSGSLLAVDEESAYDSESLEDENGAIETVTLEKSVVVYLSHRILERELDMRPETSETICTYIERLVPGFVMLPARFGTLTLRFFTESYTQLIEDGKGLSKDSREVLREMMKVAKHSNGTHQILLYAQRVVSSSQPSAESILRVSRQLKALRHADFELSDNLFVARTPAYLCGNVSLIDKLACEAHKRLVSVERVRRLRADSLLNILAKAESMLSDEQQSRFLHSSLDDYYSAVGDSAQDVCSLLSAPEQTVNAVDESERAAVTKAARHVLDSTEYSIRTVTTPRQVARILHGIQSAAFSAKDWCRCPHWGKFIHVDFLAVKRVAGGEIRARSLARPLRKP